MCSSVPLHAPGMNHCVPHALRPILLTTLLGAAICVSAQRGKAGSPELSAAVDRAQLVESCKSLRATIPHEFQWDRGNVEAAIARLEAFSGLEIRLTRRARELVDEASRRSGDGTLWIGAGAAVRQALDAVVRSMGGAWTWDGAAVRVGARGEIPGWLRLRYYDVKSLVGVSFDGHPAWHADDQEPQAAPMDPDALVSTITTLINPAIWTRVSQSQIEARNGILTVRAPDATLERIACFVATLKVAQVAVSWPHVH